MLTLTTLSEAVIQSIAAALSGTTLQDVRVLGGDAAMERPSVKVLLSSASSRQYNATCRERTLTYKVFFYARNPLQFNLENLTMQGILEGALLAGLTVGGVYIPVETVSFNMEDTVLTCSFVLTMLETLPDLDTSEITEELKFKEVNQE